MDRGGRKRRGTEAARNRCLVRRAVEEIWNRGDLALADVLFAPAYVNHGGLIPDLIHGPEAIKSSVALYRTAFPAFHITVETLVAQDEMVDVQWTARRTQSAGGAGRQEMLQGTTRGRCAAAQIVESWTTWDRAGVLQRLGLIPAAEGPGSP